jgi:hypothetical protein
LVPVPDGLGEERISARVNPVPKLEEEEELSIAALVLVKMSSNFNCSYMARSSLTYIPAFSVKFFFHPKAAMDN